MVVTKPIQFFLLFLFWFGSQYSFAAVLPEDRADALYHSYDGGGVEVTGPSILIRKSMSDSFSGSVNYYVDNVSSASIDVLTYGSPYEEERTEYSFSADYLHDKTIMSLSYTNSEESDYLADTISFNISQDMFGDLTTISLGYSQGDNTILKNGTPGFKENSTVRNYRVSLSQVLTKDSFISAVFETVSDEGYLQNPYRLSRYCDPAAPVCSGFDFQEERYPNTRTSNAFALRGRYYLPYRASIHAGYRYYADSWDIKSDTIELGYVQPFRTDWLAEITYRYYSQDKAEFYEDIYPDINSQNFLARDKELSTYNSHSIGLGVSYEFTQGNWRHIDKGSLNIYYDYIYFDYQDFRNALADPQNDPLSQPLYNFSANVLRLFVSIWY